MAGMYSRWFLAEMILLALVFVGIEAFPHVAASLAPYHEAATIGQNVSSFQELSDRFAALAKAKGADYAFHVLNVAPLPSGTDTHLLGHVVGDELYRQKGVAGIADCTPDFRNACSHAIVIGALNEFGTQKAIPLIKDACAKAPGGPGAYTMCFHGLGHGVLAYFGYNLRDAIKYCKQMGTPEYGNREYVECVGGAIMELVDGGGHDHSDWVASRAKYFTADPLSPCLSDVVPAEAKVVCIEYITPRLFEAAGADLADPSPTYFSKAFSYCDAISDSESLLKTTCYGAFGKEFIPLAAAHDIRAVDQYSDDEYENAISWCGLADNQNAKHACIGQALESVFWGGESDSQASFRLCSLVSDDGMRSSCYRELAGAITTFTSGTRESQLCAELPVDFRATCGKNSPASS
jgi:hypothetical protein